MPSSSSSSAPLPPTPTLVRIEPIVQGKKYDYIRLHIRTPKGKQLTREVVRHPGAIVIVPILPDGSVVLIRIYRVAVQQWLYECCAGTIDRERAADGTWGPGEDPASCAARELAEETGYTPGKVTHLADFFTTTGLTDERMHAYAATDLKHVGQHLEEDEYIQVHVVPPEKVLAMLDSGEIQDAKSMLALLLAHRRGLLSPKKP